MGSVPVAVPPRVRASRRRLETGRYFVACVACICDALVCEEIGSKWPDSGGAYLYLRELYGRETWGRLMAFLFIWEFLVSGPAEIASGFIAIARYLVI